MISNQAYENFLDQLESGQIRSAQKVDNSWSVNIDVKQMMLNIIRDNPSILSNKNFASFKDIRIVDGGSSIRRGAYLGKRVIIMPPSFVNFGAFVDDGTMIDSHVLVGSCAQIGKNVHLSTAVQIGGVLEPVSHSPVIIEDDCFIGAGSIITEGVLIRKGAVLAPHVSLSRSIPVYDMINNIVYKSEIPENAVVVPGSRALNKSSWGLENGLSVYCAIIIKYRDERTSSAIALEDGLRQWR